MCSNNAFVGHYNAGNIQVRLLTDNNYCPWFVYFTWLSQTLVQCFSLAWSTMAITAMTTTIFCTGKKLLTSTMDAVHIWQADRIRKVTWPFQIKQRFWSRILCLVMASRWRRIIIVTWVAPEFFASQPTCFTMFSGKTRIPTRNGSGFRNHWRTNSRVRILEVFSRCHHQMLNMWWVVGCLRTLYFLPASFHLYRPSFHIFLRCLERSVFWVKPITDRGTIKGYFARCHFERWKSIHVSWDQRAHQIWKWRCGLTRVVD